MDKYVVVKELVSKYAGIIKKDTLLIEVLEPMNSPAPMSRMFNLSLSGYVSVGEWPITDEEIIKFTEFVHTLEYSVAEDDENIALTDCPFNNDMKIASTACQHCPKHVSKDPENKTIECSCNGGRVETVKTVKHEDIGECSCPMCTLSRNMKKEDNGISSLLKDLLGASTSKKDDKDAFGNMLDDIMRKMVEKNGVPEGMLEKISTNLREQIVDQVVTITEKESDIFGQEGSTFVKTVLEGVIHDLQIRLSKEI